ncbi:MAG: hypothetical protein ACREHV_05555 [Rhizomicrobium sp.]
MMEPAPEPLVGSKMLIVSVLPVLDSCHAGIVRVAPLITPVVELTVPLIEAGVGSFVGAPFFTMNVPDVIFSVVAEVLADADVENTVATVPNDIPLTTHKATTAAADLFSHPPTDEERRVRFPLSPLLEIATSLQNIADSPQLRSAAPRGWMLLPM